MNESKLATLDQIREFLAGTLSFFFHDGASFTRVRDVATGKEHDVSVDELQGIPAIGQVKNEERRWALVRDSTRTEWKQARRRERVLNRCISGDGKASARVRFACKALGLSRRSIYRLLATFDATLEFLQQLRLLTVAEHDEVLS